MTRKDQLQLFGVRQNNLKGFNLALDHNKFTVITGISGSGKSTLAFDTIYAEGQRRYIETFSPYTRQFLERLPPPQIDSAAGVRPTLALQQQTRITNSRSTVGTVTEINDFLKILWAGAGILHCPSCHQEVANDTTMKIFKKIQKHLSSKVSFLLVAFPITLQGVASQASIRNTLEAEGFIRCYERSTGSVFSIEQLENTPSFTAGKELFVIVDRIKIDAAQDFGSQVRERFSSSIQQAYHYGKNQLLICFCDQEFHAFKEFTFSRDLYCSPCKRSFASPKPALFSFNSPLGACPACKGFGKVLLLDRTRCVPDPEKSIEEGALVCWSTPRTRHEFRALLKFCKKHEIDTSIPWKRLNKKTVDLIFQGDNKKGYRGVERWFTRLQRKVYKMHVRVFLSRYRGEFLCPECNGGRLKKEALFYRIYGKTLPEIWNVPLDRLHEFFKELVREFANDDYILSATEEINSRLSFLTEVGLEYLTLDRQSKTLSGGESQRVNLTAVLGSQLVNTMLVLDEPSIGLHSRDTNRLIRILMELRDKGNSVVVVEHDKEVIKAADEVIDLGPESASRGGEIVFQGPVSKLLKSKDSLIARYLVSHHIPLETTKSQKTPAENYLTITGAKTHNLKNITVSIPLQQLTVLSGVSGSGKSTLIDCLYQAYNQIREGSRSSLRGDSSEEHLSGIDHLDDLILIDQSPAGKTPRSNAATYTKAWEIFRECLSETPQAKALGLSKSAFSFNVDGGRCPICKGAGSHRIEMQFLADVFIECEQCLGKRFQQKVLEVELQGKNVSAILEMSLDETISFVEQLEGETKKKLLTLLTPLLELGLGYLRLGQPLSTLSGGEAQRLKLSRHLSQVENSHAQGSFFILDEPTTGLHAHDVQKLLQALRCLIRNGHTVLCVEHNLDVIANADWIVDLGPEGGEKGGEVLVSGIIEEHLNNKESLKRSPTLKLLKKQEEAIPEALLSQKEEYHPPSKPFVPYQLPPITIRGARHHNLKNISLSIPKNQLIVITGVSGSGKSTLAFDILFSEGQRRYIDCLSPYARQYITQIQKPELENISSIPPTIAVSQKTAPPLGVSTIATTTELYQYLRLLFAKVGKQHCPIHDTEIVSFTSESMTAEILNRFEGKRIFLFAPVVSGRKGHYRELFERALRAEITEARIDGKVLPLTTELKLERHKLHWISLLVASLTITSANKKLLQTATEQCLALGGGVVEVAIGKKQDKPSIFSTERVCPVCKEGFRELDPQDFSFRSKRGVCTECEGFGYQQSQRTGEKTICSSCNGARISALGRHVYIAGKNISELTELTAPELLSFLNNLTFDKRLEPIVNPIFHEIFFRLAVIQKVGLDYLKLNRDSSTLSGGEAQRLRLSRTLGSPLTGICYVLDEPTIGLHPQDHQKLLETLYQLRDQGNTVVVVEHDEETIVAADHIIDVGPGGGAAGGEIVAQGSLSDIINTPRSLTGSALSKRLFSNDSKTPRNLRLPLSSYLEIIGASANTLQNVDARFPIGRLSAVVGVSGSGKSSLVRESLMPALDKALSQGKSAAGPSWKELKNWSSFKRCVEIDQSPVGKTSASIPASYLGVLDEIRKIFALLPEAQARGWKASHFSFNTKGGRCEACLGKGVLKVPMSFLPEARTVCEECNGKRYLEPILDVQFQGFSIADLLDATFTQAREFFTHHRKIRRSLDYVHHLGIGYLTLGQPTYTLSGGELQRLKIARELGAADAIDTLYILDEPTTGLHMVDIEKLLGVLRELIAKGNTVIVIEHNLDFISAADYLLELGPGAGENGGEIIFAGPPALLEKKDTPTGQYLVARKERSNPQILNETEEQRLSNAGS